MTNKQPMLRFDHREIAVIFSLFIFVSLLMFTVGILVGKGLSQAKYESNLMIDRKLTQIGTSLQPPAERSAGTSVKSPVQGETKEPPKEATLPPSPSTTAEASTEPEGDAPELPKKAEKRSENPVQLIPQKPKDADFSGSSLAEPGTTAEVDRALKNPKIQTLLDGNAPKRDVAAKLPPSFDKGGYRVQVGSYPNEKDAGERVDILKKLGFPYAHFSAIELSEKKEKWYRVWLGYYQDEKSAYEAGNYLTKRGEVKQYIVRQTNTSG